MCFVALVGLPCSGKRTIADVLVREYGFTFLDLRADNASEPESAHKRAQEVLKQVTTAWRTHWVVVCDHMEQIEEFKRRPFFMLVAVEAPLLRCFQSWMERGTTAPMPAPASKTLEAFAAASDEYMFRSGPSGMSMRQVMAKEALVHITNGFRTVTELEEHVHTLNLASSQWTRPSWGSYFMELAHLTARRTNCMKRAVGAVLVSSNRVVATGYNGTPMNTINCAEGGCLRCNQGEASAGQLLDSCLCLHAEENALLEVGRSGARGATMYCTTCPCIGCAKKIVQSGVAVVVFDREYSMDDMTRQLFAQAGVKLERFTHHATRP